MTDSKINQANLELLIDVRQHLASAERLRDAFERLLALADKSINQHPAVEPKSKAVCLAD